MSNVRYTYINIFQGGEFVLQIPATVWLVLTQNKTLEGIQLISTPKPNPDGSYTITLTTSQWKTFQDNQKKTPSVVQTDAPKVKEESLPEGKQEPSSMEQPTPGVQEESVPDVKEAPVPQTEDEPTSDTKKEPESAPVKKEKAPARIVLEGLITKKDRRCFLSKN